MIFSDRHIGPRDHQIPEMLKNLGLSSLDELTQKAVPASILSDKPLPIQKALSEAELLARAKELAGQNRLMKSMIGLGYYDTITPSVILRNILENPAWYTAYTPYQPEISQGRLEMLFNFQTMIADLTGLPVANASLLDEATAAAEAMALCFHAQKKMERKKIFVTDAVLPQTVDVMRTRAEPLGIVLESGCIFKQELNEEYFGVVLQAPNRVGEIRDYTESITKFHSQGIMVIMATDLLALTLMKTPGEMGADIALGSSQRFGVPMGFGGPHAAFFATRDEFKRLMPGRIVGLSKDSMGRPAYRLALQTREQHIRRERATSNICTSQVLLAVIATAYAMYHGPEGLRKIAERVHGLASTFAKGLTELGMKTGRQSYFDTVRVRSDHARSIFERAAKAGYNLNLVDDTTLTVSFDETSTEADLETLWSVFAEKKLAYASVKSEATIPAELKRQSRFLNETAFNSFHSETEMMRELYRLQQKDLTLASAMIPLGSCTMKLNAATTMIPVTMEGFGRMHPLAPAEQTKGYQKLIQELEGDLAAITGFDAISLQPNAGSQGEYAGLLAIRDYHHSRGEKGRNVCLIPMSAHGTNPASAVMAGMTVVTVNCDSQGNVDLKDLEVKAAEHKNDLAALMITYPSTHGVYEEGIRKICEVIHANGGQVYMDGANLNALVGVAKPGDFGADVSHMNLHKTFGIPHGGGGPGVGPIGVKKHLSPFLPGHGFLDKKTGAVSAAPFGSASILLISWAYIRMLGAAGLKKSTQMAILNANYIARKLDAAYPVLYKGKNGMVAHECIVDCRPLKNASGIAVDDIAKRLMDFGFHAPTMSFPVVGTLMIEPTESESKEELDHFCEAMLAIRQEIAAVEKGNISRDNNPLKNAPHTAPDLMKEKWDRPYTREQAAYPLPWVRAKKFWPAVSRIDNAYGDKNLICTCPSLESYKD